MQHVTIVLSDGLMKVSRGHRAEEAIRQMPDLLNELSKRAVALRKETFMEGNALSRKGKGFRGIADFIHDQLGYQVTYLPYGKAKQFSASRGNLMRFPLWRVS